MKKGVVILFIVALILMLGSIALTLFSNGTLLTGSALFGNVALYVANGPTVLIHSPLNTTYNFAIGSTYTLDLNVSSPSQNVSTWWFTLEDLFHGTVINQSKIFSPNISFNAVRRSNRITVYANDTFGETGSKSVIFYVSVPNSAPILGNISSQLYACEASSFTYRFNATDVDEGALTMSVSPTTPFFVFPSSFSGPTFVESDLFTGVLTKSQIGNYSRTLSVSDGEYTDSKSTTITIIEINNAPAISNIGVQTVYSQGDNRTFYKQVIVTDTESGNSTSGNISFNITFNGGAGIFNITNLGVINFTANSSHFGVHNITVCASDQALSSIHPSISLCGETGLNKSVCNNFSLTVTDANRAPTILTYYPNQTTFNLTSLEEQIFNLTSYDPDGTIPDVYWYLDGGVVQYNSGNYTSQLLYTFPCGSSGAHTFKGEITDGIANDSISWNVTVFVVACPVSTPSQGGGAGGPGGPFCLPQWGCNDWQVCQNTQSSLELGIISGDDYRTVSETCTAQGYSSGECGYQTRGCFDNQYCNSTYRMPDLFQACFYSVNPSCVDGIKNCHDGSCELLVDCGGPCGTCSSCSDGLQNQGELGIDCGGPCPFQCTAETPFISYNVWRTFLLWLFWLLLLILLLILISRIIKLIKVHRELQKEKRIQSALSR